MMMCAQPSHFAQVRSYKKCPDGESVAGGNGWVFNVMMRVKKEAKGM